MSVVGHGGSETRAPPLARSAYHVQVWPRHRRPDLLLEGELAGIADAAVERVRRRGRVREQQRALRPHAAWTGLAEEDLVRLFDWTRAVPAPGGQEVPDWDSAS
jgi:hypothetical protein